MLRFTRGLDDTLTITLPVGAWNVAGATFRFVIKTEADAKTVDEGDTLAKVNVDTLLPTNVTTFDVELTGEQLELEPGRYVCGGRLFLAAGAVIPLELASRYCEVVLSTVQDVTL